MPLLTPQQSNSITALSVLSGFIVALESGYRELFGQQELSIAKHILKTAIKSENDYPLWFLESLISSLPYSAQRFFFNKTISDGYDLHKMMRKYFIKTSLEKNIVENDVQEVIYLGRGYDIRSYMLSLKFPNVNFFELDHGATRQTKLNALKTLPPIHKQPGSNIQFIECDVAKDGLGSILLEHGSLKKKKIFVIEGLTMYLTKEENRKLLNTLFQLLNEEEDVIISFSNKNKSFNQLSQQALKKTNEMYKLTLPPDEVIPFVGECGFTVVGKKMSLDMFKELGAEPGLQNSAPSLGDNYFVLQKSSNPNLTLTMESVPNVQLGISSVMHNQQSEILAM
ncbi:MULTISPECIES: class I SAM-dependent methyltransferase [unclassified Legionella]|uniref:class I SAM-dependent methyltransferase n=1 Tax=unclassified Legionella TaxID=2622702 RepID=UPI001055C28C|nr:MULTISPECIES: class I SAM-dependent methyltransferase [unclassified Legionella]MDI9818018.1 class I SAM-dependent methyltransferase [Legionella sp. PL877]